MRDYDSALPLIAIHIPKTAGTSVRKIYENWFQSGFLKHYKTPTGLPQKHDLHVLQSNERSTVIYGHFNKVRQFGVEDYYPEIEQFVTILRDPFDRAVSRYFYTKAREKNPDDAQTSESDLRKVLKKKDRGGAMLNQFPRKVTMENFKKMIDDLFIEIGTTEHLDETLNRVAAKLGKSYTPRAVPVLNVSQRNFNVPEDLREEYIDNNPLDYAVYNYVKSMYE